MSCLLYLHFIMFRVRCLENLVSTRGYVRTLQYAFPIWDWLLLHFLVPLHRLMGHLFLSQFFLCSKYMERTHNREVRYLFHLRS
jgi:hypothetical protein